MTDTPTPDEETPRACNDCKEPAQWCRSHGPTADGAQRERTLREFLGRVEGRLDFWQRACAIIVSVVVILAVAWWAYSPPATVPVWKRVPTLAQVTAVHERAHADCVAEFDEDDVALLCPLEACSDYDWPAACDACPPEHCPPTPTPTTARVERLKSDLKEAKAEAKRSRKYWTRVIANWDHGCAQCSRTSRYGEKLLCDGCSGKDPNE